MTQDQIVEHFRSCGALLEGHFLLSSGLHSRQYLQCAIALQYPADAQRFAMQIADHFLDAEIQTVASPAIGGLVLGYAVASALNVRFIWTERQNGAMTLRRGFTVKSDDRLLVVEDVVTTGGSTRECIAAIEDLGAAVVGAASLIDRSNGTADVGVPIVSLANFEVPSYTPASCPMCAFGSVPEKPGSRG
ncbi:MAG: orotate phosphoribosyltransferase [Acidobacteriota bacterium]